MALKAHVYPSYAQFRRMSRRGNLIPVYGELIGDLETPVSAFLKVAAQRPSSFLFESVEHGEKLGRYSFIGFDPFRVVAARRGQDVTGLLRSEMQKYKLVRSEGLPAFCGGFVGFLGYENVRFFESIAPSPKEGLEVAESIFFLTKKLILFDQLERTVKIVALCDTDRGLPRAYRWGKQAVQETMALLSRATRAKETFFEPPGTRRTALELKSNMRRRKFEDRVRKIKRYIRQGDCIQVVYSQRFDLGRVAREFDVYRALRVINPSPYMFYFKHADTCLVGSSPELLVKKTGRTAEVRPIAGTRRRGKTESQDLALEQELKTSEKEKAEHLMLVDLGRNDLGRVCRFRSVKVRDYARVERYSHVMHLVSDVSGELRPSEDAFSLLRATFPAGTVTGAPKVRAMEIIDELETDRRGPYAGAMGYFSFNGDMDMCIMIRTIVVKNKRAYVQAGAGIVFDSDPGREYEETVNKAKALFEAVRMARERS
jgi:anthranilate synthase component 1